MGVESNNVAIPHFRSICVSRLETLAHNNRHPKRINWSANMKIALDIAQAMITVSHFRQPLGSIFCAFGKGDLKRFSLLAYLLFDDQMCFSKEPLTADN